ncbi:GGDEF domain-containing protein [Neogemmobacter tilapiae]|uniref:diguanylate cyclase n=1 Tax=Neogemmobacter tilapiae TaxID=875041 RepID=A0A918TSJ1_9RHOB|nr:GGDEF domain-containing protein [Gemmobacter tilapiae]GHC61475.1 transcriptional regulator [Gemmobacter tilapiae]
MRIYKALARLFPGSFTAKVFFLAFVGTHVPLIVLIAYLLGGPDGLSQHLDILAMVLVATLVGTAATLFALKAILRPVYQVERAMQRFEDEGIIAPLPQDMQDELGRLMQRAGRMMARLQDRIETTQRSADTDPLTGVLNRRGFERRTARDGSGAVLHFDLDHFKAINDRLGHDAGDQVLQDVARLVADGLRQDDVLARFGGEEFVVFLSDVSAEEARLAAERLRRAIAENIRAGGAAVTASVGVSHGAGTLAERIARADQATYLSKNTGRNRVTVLPMGDQSSAA